MTEAMRAFLRRSLLASYSDLIGRLTRRLGSPDLAAEALHETYLRLEQPGNIGEVANPESYLYRAAVNTAANIRRSDSRHLGEEEIKALLDISDDAPDPERIVLARAEVDSLRRALAELPERQSVVFSEVMFDNTPYPVLAERFGVSTRTIYKPWRIARVGWAKNLSSKSSAASCLESRRTCAHDFRIWRDEVPFPAITPRMRRCLRRRRAMGGWNR
jgi:RNA polymerase sigma-70 factor, ECF subfamily